MVLILATYRLTQYLLVMSLCYPVVFYFQILVLLQKLFNLLMGKMYK